MGYTNLIKLTGKVRNIKERDSEHVVLTILSFNGVERDGRKHDIFPHCICRKDLLPPSILSGDKVRVSISGHFERSIRNLRGKKVPSQQIIVDTIEEDTTMAEKAFGKKGKFYNEYAIKAYLSGPVVKFTTEQHKNGREWARIVVNTGGTVDDEKNSLSMSMPVPDRMPEIKVGDVIYCVCNMDTPEKMFEGKRERYEDILVMDIAIDK